MYAHILYVFYYMYKSNLKLKKKLSWLAQFINAYFCATCRYVQNGHASETIRNSTYVCVFKPHGSLALRNIAVGSAKPFDTVRNARHVCSWFRLRIHWPCGAKWFPIFSSQISKYDH
jgi:hypothetical protein